MKYVATFILIFLLAMNAIGATPPTHTNVLYSDDLYDNSGSGVGTMVNSGGTFLAGQGWRATTSSSQLKITLPANLPAEGTLKVDVTNFNPATQNVADKQNIVNLYSRAIGSVDGANPAGTTANLRTGTSYSDGAGMAGFKLLAAAEWVVNGRQEERTMQNATWSTSATYEFKIVWTQSNIFFLFNGVKKVELIFTNPEEPFRYIFLGRDNQYSTGQPGPIYSNLTILTTGGTPPPPTEGLSFTNITYAAGVEGLKAVEKTTDDPADIKTFGHGVSFGDFDRNGFYDFIYTNAGALAMTDILYLNQGDNTFINSSAACGVNDIGHTHCILNADWNNDGYLDLFYSNQPVYIGEASGRNRMYRNNGSGVFTEITTTCGLSAEKSYSRGSVAVDMNNDGWLDLFVLNWGSTADTYNTINEVYLNDGDGTFTRVHNGCDGPTNDPVTYGRQGATAADIDNDGDQDIYMCRRGKPNWLFINDGSGNYTEGAAARGIACTDGVRHHGATFVDIDTDGDLDLFVMPYGTPGVALPLMRAFINNGNGYFTDRTTTYNIPISGYSILFGDVDNDADLDLFMQRNSEQDPGTTTKLYLNDGDGNLTYSSQPALEVDAGDVRGGAMGDIDNDGDLDIYMACSRGDNNFLFRNDLNSDNHYVRVLCVGPGGDYGGFGSKVSIYQPGHLGDNNYLLGYQESVSNYSYLCQNQTALHFGLGAYTTCDIRVVLTDGSAHDYTNVQADTELNMGGSANVGAPEISGATINAQNRLTLTWGAVDGATGYNVYRGTTANFEADVNGGSNRVASAVSDGDAGTDGVQWTDTGVTVGNPAVNYFYRVTAIKNTGQGPLSECFGKFDYNLVTTTTTDFNEIALSLHNSAIATAADMMNTIPYCNSVAKWNAATQGYDQYVPGLDFTNFNVVDGYPYYVNVTAGSVFTLTGVVTDPSFTLVTTATTDFNEVMLPLDKTTLTTAVDLLNDIAYCNSVAKWNATSQGYTQYVPGLDFTNFAIATGYPYYVNVTQGSVWPGTALAKRTGPGEPATIVTLPNRVPHLVYGKINTTGDISDVRFTVKNESGAAMLVSGETPGCDIKDNYWYAQLGNSESGWQAGDEVTIEFYDEAGNDLGRTSLTLSFNPADCADMNVSDVKRAKRFELYNNYPNPFNPETTIKFSLPEAGHVQAEIVDISGRSVKSLVNGNKSPGMHAVVWDGRDNAGAPVATGVYFYVMQYKEKILKNKLLLIK